jgi:iron(II)-dependent oxidoreductase
VRERFGGVDAILVWPTYTNLGVDDRNAYDMIRSLPGGISAIRTVVRSRALHHTQQQQPLSHGTQPWKRRGLHSPALLAQRQIEQLHAQGVRVLWPLMGWDVATRYEGREPEAMVNMLRQTGADGLNADTITTIPEAYWRESVAQGVPAALQAEHGGSLHSLAYTTLGWGESGAPRR